MLIPIANSVTKLNKKNPKEPHEQILRKTC